MIIQFRSIGLEAAPGIRGLGAFNLRGRQFVLDGEFVFGPAA